MERASLRAWVSPYGQLDFKAIAGYLQLAMEVRMWSRTAVSGDHYDIYEIEAVGPALILHNFGSLFEPDALWVQLIVNDSALATLVKGSFSVLSGEVITTYTQIQGNLKSLYCTCLYK